MSKQYTYGNKSSNSVQSVGSLTPFSQPQQQKLQVPQRPRLDAILPTLSNPYPFCGNNCIPKNFDSLSDESRAKYFTAQKKIQDSYLQKNKNDKKTSIQFLNYIFDSIDDNIELGLVFGILKIDHYAAAYCPNQLCYLFLKPVDDVLKYIHQYGFEIEIIGSEAVEKIEKHLGHFLKKEEMQEWKVSTFSDNKIGSDGFLVNIMAQLCLEIIRTVDVMNLLWETGIVRESLKDFFNNLFLYLRECDKKNSIFVFRGSYRCDKEIKNILFTILFVTNEKLMREWPQKYQNTLMGNQEKYEIFSEKWNNLINQANEINPKPFPNLSFNDGQIAISKARINLWNLQSRSFFKHPTITSTNSQLYNSNLVHEHSKALNVLSPKLQTQTQISESSASTTEHVNNYPDIIENQKDFSQIQMSRDQFDELPFYIKEKIMREHPKFKDEDHEENNDSSDLNSQPNDYYNNLQVDDDFSIWNPQPNDYYNNLGEDEDFPNWDSHSGQNFGDLYKLSPHSNNFISYELLNLCISSIDDNLSTPQE